MNNTSANVAMAYLVAEDVEKTILHLLPQACFVTRPLPGGKRLPHSMELFGILVEAFSGYTATHDELSVYAMGDYFHKKFYKGATGSLMFNGYDSLGYLARKGELAPIIARAAKIVLSRTVDLEPVDLESDDLESDELEPESKDSDNVYNRLFLDFI